MQCAQDHEGDEREKTAAPPTITVRCVPEEFVDRVVPFVVFHMNTMKITEERKVDALVRELVQGPLRGL